MYIFCHRTHTLKYIKYISILFYEINVHNPHSPVGDISKDGGLILSEEDMLAIISRVSSKYSVKLASKESQTLMDGIKLKAAQKGIDFRNLYYRTR